MNSGNYSGNQALIFKLPTREKEEQKQNNYAKKRL